MATSSAPSWGPNLIKAVEMAAEEVNSKGGISGKKISVKVLDEGPTSASALYTVHKMVEEDKIPVIIGGTSSEAVISIGSYAQSKSVLIVSPTATSAALADKSWSKWVYRVAPADILQGGVVAKIIKDKGIKRVALLVQDSVYGRGIEESIRQYLSGASEIVADIRYDPSKLSYLAELNEINDKVPGCVVHAGYYADGAVIYAQAMQSKLDNIPWITVDGTYDMPLDKYLDAAKFMEKTVTGTVPAPDVESSDYQTFKANYKSKYGFDPTIYCDTSYDALNMVAAAIKKADSYNGRLIRDALLEISKDYTGVSGSITFDQNGERVAGHYGIWKVVMEGTQYKYAMTGEYISFLK